MKNLCLPLALLGIALAATSCKDNDSATPTPTPLASTTVSNLAAGVTTTTGGAGQPTSATKYTFFSLADNKVIANTDSNSTKWDLGFKGTTIITNSGTSGPGQGGALVYTGLYNDLAAAPETGYSQDAATGKAVPTGSGNGWYNYDQTTNIISPIAGKVLVVRTATGKYAKLEIVSYYKDAPAAPTATSSSRYYTFRYLYQPNGTKSLK